MKSIVRIGLVQPRRSVKPGEKDPIKFAEDIAMLGVPDAQGQCGDFESVHIQTRVSNEALFGKLAPNKKYELELREIADPVPSPGGEGQGEGERKKAPAADVEPVATQTA